MLTLKETRLTLKTINLLSYVGILPYQWNEAAGKLEGLSYYRLVFWYLSALLSTLHVFNTISQAVKLYVLSDHINLPLHIVLIHIMYTNATFMLLSIVMYAKTKMHGAILLVFNQLFTGAKLLHNTRERSWKQTKLVDLVLRLYFPVVTFYLLLGWSLVLIFESNMPIQAINNQLLAPLKGYRILVLLFVIADLHAVGFLGLNFYFLNCLLYFSCEKVKHEGRAARDSIRFKGPSHRPLRRAMASARCIQLRIVLTNHVGCWVVCTQKLVFIVCVIFFAYIVIRASSQNVFLGIFAGASCFSTIFSWSVTCYFANLVPEETRKLAHDIALSSGPFFRADVGTYMRSVRRGYVQDGSFRAIARESFLIFMDFIVNQIVALLLI